MKSVLPARRQAAGAPSAWSSPPNPPTNDHADGATLGRWDAGASMRPRRPEMRKPRTVAVSASVSVSVSVSVAVAVADPDHGRCHGLGHGRSPGRCPGRCHGMDTPGLFISDG